MNTLELIITILFVLVIWMVVQDIPVHLIVPFLAMLFTVLFIGFDNMRNALAFDSYNTSGLFSICSKKGGVFSDNVVDITDSTDNEMIVEEAVDDIKVERITAENETKTPKEFEDIPTPDFKLNDTEPLTYDEYKYRENLFPDASCGGDYLLAEKMKHMGLQPKVSMDAQARVNKYTNYGYLAEELDSHANSRWWDDETLEDEF
jgi:hypothetical protein